MAKKKPLVPSRATGSNAKNGPADPKPSVYPLVPKVLIPMSFLNWVDPPIGIDLTNVPGLGQQTPYCKVSFLTASASANGPIIALPFVESIPWYPSAAPSTLLQYQLTSGLPIDPTTAYYYLTMVVSLTTPVQLTLRCRVPLKPLPTAEGFEPVTLSTAAAAPTPNIIQVSGSGFVNSYNQPVTVQYQHFLPADSCGPPDLYLQQP